MTLLESHVPSREATEPIERHTSISIRFLCLFPSLVASVDEGLFHANLEQPYLICSICLFSLSVASDDEGLFHADMEQPYIICSICLFPFLVASDDEGLLHANLER